MAYFASQIANEFIRRGLTDRVTVDPLKVQKLVYLAHGWHLAFLGVPLIRETVEAWKFGPVVPDLYRSFRTYGYGSITREVEVPSDAVPLDPNTESLCSEIWKKYGRISGVELSAMTHEPGYAWELARRGHENSWSSPGIPETWIQDEFRRRLAIA